MYSMLLAFLETCATTETRKSHRESSRPIVVGKNMVGVSPNIALEIDWSANLDDKIELVGQSNRRHSVISTNGQ